jgi:hypothetical protein
VVFKDMTNKSKTIYFKIQEFLFLIFLCFLPFEVFPFIHFSSSSTGFFSFDFYIHLFGLLLLVFSFWDKRVFYVRNFVVSLFVLCFFLMLLSLADAWISFSTFNGYYGTNPFLVVLYESAKYFHFVTIVFYVTYFLPLVSKKDLVICFFVAVGIVFLVSTLQLVFLFTKNSLLGSFYDKMCLFFGFEPTTFIVRQGGRITGTYREPAHFDMFFGCFFLPVMFSWFLFSKQKKTIQLFLWCFLLLYGFVLAYFSKSSSVYVVVFIGLLMSFFLFFKRLANRQQKIRALGVLFIFLSIFIAGFFSTAVGKNLYSLMIQKVFSSTNDSTLYRYSRGYNDLLIFLRMPIIGCGNGMQGYYYFDNIVNSKFAKAYESIQALSGQFGLIYGSGFIPTYLSSFGLFGLFLALPIGKQYFALIKQTRENSKILFGILLIALPSLFVLLCVNGELTMNYQAVVLLSLPFINNKKGVDFRKSDSFFEDGFLNALRQSISYF